MTDLKKTYQIGLSGPRSELWRSTLTAHPHQTAGVQFSLRLIQQSSQMIERDLDAILLPADRLEPTRARLSMVPTGCAVALVLGPGVQVNPADLAGWMQLGIHDVIPHEDLHAESILFRLQVMIERERQRETTRYLHTTDLGTGLPQRQQLIEHMSHLLALRTREPATMAVIAMRIEGLAQIETQHGREAAQVLRRKVAVRLRAVVRASDVVATLNDDLFAILLSSIGRHEDAMQVGQKLLVTLQTPFRVGGIDVALATAMGVAQVDADGDQPDQLLAWATQRAQSAPAHSRITASANEV